MNDHDFIKGSLVLSYMENLSPSVRKSILDDGFLESKFELLTTREFKIDFDNTEILFDGESFIKGIMKFYESNKKTNLTISDKSNKPWSVRFDGVGIFLVGDDSFKIKLESYFYFDMDVNVRTLKFDEYNKKINLSKTKYDYWIKILQNRPVTFKEFFMINDDFLNTPISLLNKLTNIIHENKGHVILNDCIPKSREYFEQIIGVYKKSSSIRQYVFDSGVSLLNDLTCWKKIEGLKFFLHICCHPALVDIIAAENLTLEEFENLYNFSLQSSPIVKLGVVEIGFKMLSSYPVIEENICELISSIFKNEIDIPTDALKINLGLFILTDSVLSKRKTLSGLPPFYRRLASFAHASLLYPSFSQANSDDLYNLIVSEFGEQFFLQNTIDTREEPYWWISLFSEKNIHLELLSRVLQCGFSISNIQSYRCLSILINKLKEKLTPIDNAMLTFPHPVESAQDNPNILDFDLENMVIDQLNCNPPKFSALINFSSIYCFKPSLIELLTEKLENINYSFDEVLSNEEIVTVLEGLSYIASKHKDRKLAESIKRIILKLSNQQKPLNIKEHFFIIILYNGSYIDSSDWLEAVSSDLKDLAFSNISADDAYILNGYVVKLIQMGFKVPTKLGKAKAALEALICL